MTFLPSLSFVAGTPHRKYHGGESITPLRQQCQYALPRATRSWILQSASAYKRHEALKNDGENGGVKNVSGKCCIIVQSSITFVVILGWHTPQDVPIPSIHNVIAVAMSNALPRATRSWILQTASAYKTALGAEE